MHEVKFNTSGLNGRLSTCMAYNNSYSEADGFVKVTSVHSSAFAEALSLFLSTQTETFNQTCLHLFSLQSGHERKKFAWSSV